MLSVVTEPVTLPWRFRKVLKGGSLGSCGGNNDGVFHSVVVLEGLCELADGRTLLTDGDLDAVQLLYFILTIVPPPLTKDGVDSGGGLSGLTVTDDQLVLTTTDGHHGVDGINTGHHGLIGETTG